MMRQVLLFLLIPFFAEAQSGYDLAIHQADSAYEFFFSLTYPQTKDVPRFERARALYILAYQENPSKTYATERIREINRVLDGIERNSLADKNYTLADSFFFHAGLSFQQEDFARALKYYLRADSVKPSEASKEKALLCSDLVLMNSKDSIRTFLEFITKGDIALGIFNSEWATDKYDEENLKAAQKNFGYALAVNKNSRYAKQKLEEANKFDGSHDREKQYKDLVWNGDRAFIQKDYARARDFYSQALALKPGQDYPQAKIIECDKELNKPGPPAKWEEQFKEQLTKANDLFAKKKYEEAKKAYQAALKLKPADKYCEDQIKKIDLILEQ